MKLFVTLFFVLSSFSFLFSQNQYFVPFDTDISGLYEHLDRYGGLEFDEATDEENVLVSHLESKINYRFHQDSIYQITESNPYSKKKAALEAYESCQTFLRKIEATEVTFFVRGSSQHLIYIKEDVSYELIFTEENKRDLTVSLTAKCVRFTPEDQLEYYDYLTDF